LPRVKPLWEAARWLLRLGAPPGDVARAARLARRATVVRLEKDEAVVAVPSQRLGAVPPERPVAHRDLAAILEGGEPRIAEAVVGRLPEEQQVYMVRVTPRGAACGCPATRLGGDPLCVHKMAAAMKLYTLGRLDLLAWLPEAVREKRSWRQRRHRPRGAQGRGGAGLAAWLQG